MTRPFRFGLLGILLPALAGCTFQTFTYTVDRYGTVGGVNVTLRCRDTYEVYDRPDARTFVVITNGLNEVLAGCLDGGPPLPERQREVARIFLEEKTNRPECRLVGDVQLTPVHREFTYACEAPAGRAPGRPRRG